jgi:tellurite resistance protein TehA-like permease
VAHTYPPLNVEVRSPRLTPAGASDELLERVRRLRPHYDMGRWATVFPMGTTAVATLSVAVADAAAVGWLRTPGQALLWIAVVAWVITLVGLVRRLAA